MLRTYRPEAYEDALLLRREMRAIPLAGGTDLMVERRRWSGLSPRFDMPVLFIGHVRDLKMIRHTGDTLRIGAACTLSDLLESEGVPCILKKAVAEMASHAIRNVATIGGNVCNASPAGDTLPPLYSLNADLVLDSLTGQRTIPISKFIRGPGLTALRDDELLREIVVREGHYDVNYYRKVGMRKAVSLSKVSFVGLVKRTEGEIEDIRISFGAVAPTVVRSQVLEDRLLGCDETELVHNLPGVLDGYAQLLEPIDDQRSTAHYRKTIALGLLEHFLAKEAL
jgi:xanthine dehydrogenase FAD-binding subunit